MSERSTTATLLRIFPYAKSAIPRTVWGTVAALGSYGAALYMPQVLSHLINSLQSHGTVGMVWGLALATLGIGVIEVGLLFLRRWLVLAPGTHVEANLRRSLYEKLQDLPVSFHDRWPSGQLLSRATGDLGLIRRWLSFGLVMLTANTFVIVIGLIVLFGINWMLGTLFLVFSIPIWFKGFRFESQYHTMARLSQDQGGDLATSIEQAIHGVRVLKAFGRGEFMASKFAVDSDELRNTEVKKAKLIAGIWVYLILVPEFAAGFALLVGVYLMATHQISVGSLVAFFATATVMRWPTESIGFMLSMTLDAKTAVERFFEVLDAPVEIADPSEVQTIADPKGRLEFRDVRFRFADVPEDGEDLIKGVNLVVQPGESIALIGVTGCGKSTLTSLTTRLYDVTGGEILLDGVDIRSLSRENLRANIAMAFEDATLFSASVRENVLLGNPDATEGDLAQALEIAQAGFAYDLPEGLETKIGEEGMSLSGGQRQRLALARAVAAKPKVLVLDDPLSALDVDTEAMVEEALRTVLATTSALIVAHRPSTVKLADKVALMEDGRISAFGTHSELLATNAHYRHVISSLDEESKSGVWASSEEAGS